MNKKVKKWVKKILFGFTVGTLGGLLGITILFFSLMYLFGCNHIPEPKMNQAIEFYDQNVKNFPNTNP
jgi:uncharacterized membrane protein YfcA